ncbi:MAG: hypothetical protein ACRCUQ_01900, partial [Alphaproteobacteria bacterium]
MNKEEFIEGIRYDRDEVVKSVIRPLVAPPGRKHSKRDIRLSNFYLSLDGENQKNIEDIVAESVNAAIFSFLCILDHVGFIEDDEDKTHFELYAVKNGKRVLINDEEQEMLH